MEGMYTLDDISFPVRRPDTENNRGLIGLSRGHAFATTGYQNDAGDSQPLINQDEAIFAFTYRFKRYSEECANIQAFHLGRRGSGYAFWLADPYDYQDNDNAGAGKVVTMGDGNKYLVKAYDEVRPYYRIIRGALVETVEFSGVSGSPVYQPGTGLVTGATSEGEATFQFRVPVRFSTDVYKVNHDPTFGDIDGIDMVEVRRFEIAS